MRMGNLTVIHIYRYGLFFSKAKILKYPAMFSFPYSVGPKNTNFLVTNVISQAFNNFKIRNMIRTSMEYEIKIH